MHNIVQDRVEVHVPLTHVDYFHPSAAGQAHIASVVRANFYDFRATTPPVSDSSTSAITGGVLVQLTATDAAGISRIEYS